MYLAKEQQKRLEFGVCCDMYHRKESSVHLTLCNFCKEVLAGGFLEGMVNEITAQFESQYLKINKEGL